MICNDSRSLKSAKPWEQLLVSSEDISSDSKIPYRCPTCGEEIHPREGIGSGRLSDGIYCSLTCFALKDNRYIPSIEQIYEDGLRD
jgi:hypothetical protein